MASKAVMSAMRALASLSAMRRAAAISACAEFCSHLSGCHTLESDSKMARASLLLIHRPSEFHHFANMVCLGHCEGNMGGGSGNQTGSKMAPAHENPGGAGKGELLG